jgi:hypothetical protein
VREAQSKWHSPAVSAGIVRDGALVWSTHAGSARLDPITAPTNDSQYLIGSITKTFTAVLIMALRDAGRLSLNDRLENYLPQTRHGAVTIRQMLAHASGLQREPVGRIWENSTRRTRSVCCASSRTSSRCCPPTSPSTTPTSRSRSWARSWNSSRPGHGAMSSPSASSCRWR